MAKGLNDIKKMLKNKGVELSKKSDAIVSKTAFIGRNEAIKKAPSAFGKLRQGINVEKTYLKAKVQSQAPYSVYLEFGTGKKVAIPTDTPEELKKIANQYKGKKANGLPDFWTGLERWARLKGIPAESVYPIGMSLIEEGQKPQPFMRPAYKEASKYLKLELAKL